MIPLPLQPKVIEKEDNWAKFEIEALYPGYGVTVGNALRRVLLSSLGGAAITQVKIKGIPHEFSTIEGILEDVVTLSLNLKQMRFRLLSEEPQIATLKVKGEKEIKAKDFEFPSQVELVNKDCHIATLTKKSSELEMEITIEKGVGYSSVESRNIKKQEIGVITLDSTFTPVERVAMRVENMRVGDRTDFDKLSLMIQTDGSIQPETAFFKASRILVDHFSLLKEAFNEEDENIKKGTEESAPAKSSGETKEKKVKAVKKTKETAKKDEKKNKSKKTK